MKRWKKVTIVGLILLSIGTATVFANDAYETLRGRKVSVYVNGENIKAQAYNIDGVTMLPLRAVAESLQAIVTSRAPFTRVDVYKPNAHLFLVESANNRTFAAVEVGKRYDFVVFAQVDELAVSVDSLKVTVSDPQGNILVTREEAIEDDMDSIWYASNSIRQQFKLEGNYKIDFYLRLKGSSQYSLVAEKVIQAKK